MYERVLCLLSDCCGQESIPFCSDHTVLVLLGKCEWVVAGEPCLVKVGCPARRRVGGNRGAVGCYLVTR